MNELKCYYAHSMFSYGSTIEEQDLQALFRMGFEVINPNTPAIQKGCEVFMKNFGRDRVMEYFNAIVEDCQVFAFRGLPDGTILSGIATELRTAKEKGLIIIEFPSMVDKRMVDYKETKQYLIELGHYKI